MKVVRPLIPRVPKVAVCEKRLVELAVVENKVVVVAFVRMVAPETVRAVEDAYGKVLANVVDVAVKYVPTTCPATESSAYGEVVPIPRLPPKNEEPFRERTRLLSEELKEVSFM